MDGGMRRWIDEMNGMECGGSRSIIYTYTERGAERGRGILRYVFTKLGVTGYDTQSVSQYMEFNITQHSAGKPRHDKLTDTGSLY
jgi:hypothetical protein